MPVVKCPRCGNTTHFQVYVLYYYKGREVKDLEELVTLQPKLARATCQDCLLDMHTNADGEWSWSKFNYGHNYELTISAIEQLRSESDDLFDQVLETLKEAQYGNKNI